MTNDNFRSAARTITPILAGLIALLLPAAATAGAVTPSSVSLASAIFVEHTARQNGTSVRSLEPAVQLAPGERVVTLVKWSRPAGRGIGGFILVNALPARLNYQQSTQVAEEVSVDGGRSWGRLGTLRIAGRAATAADVTHVRWHVTPAQAAEGSGQIAYAGIVR